MRWVQYSTGRIRLLHKNDGSYILQQEQYYEPHHKSYWIDMPIIEENDLENEKFVKEFEWLKVLIDRTDNEYLKERVKEESDLEYKDDYGENFTMNNKAVDDFYSFYVKYKKEFNKINFAFFINDNGNIYLQKTTNDMYIYIEFKGDREIMYNIKCNENDRVKKDVTIKDFWNEMNERNIMNYFEKSLDN